MPRFSVILAFALGSSALAQSVFRWVDADGATHYTNDANEIPKGVKVLPPRAPPSPRWERRAAEFPKT